MLRGIDINEMKEYVLASDTGEKPTVFLIGHLSNAFQMRVLGSIIQPDGKPDPKAVQNEAGSIVLEGVKGVRGFYDPSVKNVVDLKADEINGAFLEKLPLMAQLELAGKILEFNFVSESEIKN